VKVIIASRIFSPEPAAASFMLEAVARALVIAGDEVEVITSSLPRGQKEITPDGFSISRAPVLRDRSGYLRGYLPYMSFDIPLFFRLLFRQRADLYFIEPPPTSGAVMRVIAWLKRKPYFYDAADIWSDAAALATGNRLVLSVLRKIELYSLRGAREIFTISTGVEKRLIQLGINNDVTVVGFGVDTTIFQYVQQESAAQKYFVYAGTYSEPHGASVFVRAFSEFSRLDSSYKLIFVGNGSERKDLEQLASDLALDTIEFRNPVSPEELNNILNKAVASLASLKPGTGYEYAFTTKIYASLAAGCPVIFSGAGPTHRFMRNIDTNLSSGVAVDFDTQQVLEAMILVAQSPLSNQGRKNLSDWSRDNFSIDVIAKNIVSSIHLAVRP
jgi:glycosyltransferase involved in cell wall biosynthesis